MLVAYLHCGADVLGFLLDVSKLVPDTQKRAHEHHLTMLICAGAALRPLSQHRCCQKVRMHGLYQMCRGQPQKTGIAFCVACMPTPCRSYQRQASEPVDKVQATPLLGGRVRQGLAGHGWLLLLARRSRLLRGYWAPSTPSVCLPKAGRMHKLCVGRKGVPGEHRLDRIFQQASCHRKQAGTCGVWDEQGREEKRQRAQSANQAEIFEAG